jgi:hypothetical protein
MEDWRIVEWMFRGVLRVIGKLEKLGKQVVQGREE